MWSQSIEYRWPQAVVSSLGVTRRTGILMMNRRRKTDRPRLNHADDKQPIVGSN